MLPLSIIKHNEENSFSLLHRIINMSDMTTFYWKSRRFKADFVSFNNPRGPWIPRGVFRLGNSPDIYHPQKVNRDFERRWLKNRPRGCCSFFSTTDISERRSKIKRRARNEFQNCFVSSRLSVLHGFIGWGLWSGPLKDGLPILRIILAPL